MEIFAGLFYIYFLVYIGMGFVQPLAAICRLLGEKRKDSKYAIGLKKYLLAVGVYFLLLYVMLTIFSSYDLYPFMSFYLLILPWALSIWYIIHVRVWRNKRKNIRDFDKEQLLEAPHEDRLLLDSFPKKKVQFKYPASMYSHKNKEIKKAVIRSLPILYRAT